MEVENLAIFKKFSNFFSAELHVVIMQMHIFNE